MDGTSLTPEQEKLNALRQVDILFYSDTHSGFIRTLFRSAIFSKIRLRQFLFFDLSKGTKTLIFDKITI